MLSLLILPVSAIMIKAYGFQAVIRMHLAKKGLGLFNDLQNEHSIVGNFPDM
jgi:hypothetical protein